MHKTNTREAYDAVEKLGEATYVDVMDALGWEERPAKRALLSLHARGLIVSSPRAAHEPARWRVVAPYPVSVNEIVLEDIIRNGPGTKYEIASRTGLDAVNVGEALGRLVENRAVASKAAPGSSPNVPRTWFPYGWVDEDVEEEIEREVEAWRQTVPKTPPPIPATVWDVLQIAA